MKMILTAVIIDDEQIAREVLHKLLVINSVDICIVGEADSIESAVLLIEEKKPDLVFLDIHLTEENSFNLLSNFEPIPFEIIFISGDQTYGVSAFKVNAIDFVMKPIDGDDLVAAVEKAALRINEKKLLHTEEVKISIHDHSSVAYISSNEICSLIAQDNYTQIITSENKNYTASKTLGSIETELAKTGHFIRIHRSILINVRKIVSYTKSDPCTIKLSNGSDYEVSRRKKGEILIWLKTYLG